MPNPLVLGFSEVYKDGAKFLVSAIELQNVSIVFANVETAMSSGTDNISNYVLTLALPSVS